MLKKSIAAAFCACLAFVFSDSTGAVEMKQYAWNGMEAIALADVDRDPNPANNPGLLVGLSDAEKAALPPGVMGNSINCYIVRMGGEVLLFDAGLGGAYGQLIPSMAQAGLKPGDVTAVIITHFHPDHIGGLVKDGKAAFPNAGLILSRVEVEAMAQAAKTFMPAYAGRVQTFEWDQQIAPGVTAREALGHTPGHTVFEVEAGGSRLWILGDLIHFAGLQLARPEIAVTYDTDPVKAVAARKRIFDKAAAEGVTVAGMHLPFPGIGKFSKVGAGYGFAETK